MNNEIRLAKRSVALRAFIVGYLSGRSSLDNHDPAGREAEVAFNKWWTEVGHRLYGEAP